MIRPRRFARRSTSGVRVLVAFRKTSSDLEKVVTNLLNVPIFGNVSSLFRANYYDFLMFLPMPLYLIAAALIYGSCLLKVVLAAIDAPIGYEDRRGFHYGMETIEIEAED